MRNARQFEILPFANLKQWASGKVQEDLNTIIFETVTSKVETHSLFEESITKNIQRPNEIFKSVFQLLYPMARLNP